MVCPLRYYDLQCVFWIWIYDDLFQGVLHITVCFMLLFSTLSFCLRKLFSYFSVRLIQWPWNPWVFIYLGKSLVPNYKTQACANIVFFDNSLFTVLYPLGYIIPLCPGLQGFFWVLLVNYCSVFKLIWSDN